VSKYPNTSHDPGKDHIVETYDNHIHLDKPQEIKTIFTSSVNTPTVKILDRYNPLVLPPILHDFPANYYKYLPRFDGEYGNITTEKHIQGFENFLYLFEVEEDDVCIKIFSLYFQSKAKSGSRTYQLQALVISISL
jgi:hypothetical protein